MGSSFGFLTVGSDETREPTSFTDSLASHLRKTGTAVAVVAVGNGGHTGPGSAPTGWAEQAASVVAASDVVIVDHAIRAPSEADRLLLDVMARLRCPIIVRLSAVARVPSRYQRIMYGHLERVSDVVVVSSGAARRRLATAYAIVSRRVVLISDAARPLARVTDVSAGVSAPTVVTSGVIGPDRGLETAIDAMAGLRSLAPRPRYVIAGRTEAAMLARDGEVYRHALMARTIDRGVAPMVRFVNDSVDGCSERQVSPVDLVIVTDVHPDQMNSRIVLDALAAGTPVVALMTSATRRAAIAAGIERLVPAADPVALSGVLRFLLTDPVITAAVACRGMIGPEPMWHRIADQYRELAAELIAARTSATIDRCEPLLDSRIF